MEGRELPVFDGEGAARVVRALGKHRYVAGRLHLVHAFAYAALVEVAEEVAPAVAWAQAVLCDATIDKGSRDERLFRASSEPEVAAVLAAFWGTGAARDEAHARLRAHLAAADIPLQDHAPFDEAREEDAFPVLVDAGWELVPLASLDPERHKGAILAFGEPILFAAAIFEEESATARGAYLQELSALGPAELLRGSGDDGALASPFTVWTSGPDAYHDYLLRGVLRAAKIDVPADE
jgi:hypothetical protein